MTIEVLKAEMARLTRLERLEFLQFLAGLLASEEGIEPLPEAQRRTLLRRRDDLRSGRVTAQSTKKVKAKLIEKYGLQA